MARGEGELHHILHHRTLHESNKYAKTLRRSLGMIALLEHDSHYELHRACPGVPALDIFMVQRVVNLYVPHANPIVGIENFQRAVETAKNSPRSHELERSLADLAIMAVDLQKPFIKEGLINKNE